MAVRRETTPRFALEIRRNRVLRWCLYLGFAVLIGNTGAIVDALVHPEISYFDVEHRIVGAVTAATILLLLAGMERWAYRRYRAEIARGLRNAERHRAILQTALSGFCVVDLQGHLQEVNAAYCLMSGYGEQELLAMRISDLEVEEDPEATASHLRKVVANGYARFESRHRRKDGRVIDVDVSVEYQSSEGGFLVAFLRDISDRKEAERALQERETLLKTTLASTVDGILVVDGHGRTILTNPQFADIWGIPASVLESRDDAVMLKFVLDQVVDPEAFQRRVASLYTTDAVDLDEIHFKDGRVIERYSLPLRSDGVPLGRVWSFRDVTEHKRAEKALRLRDERFRLLFDRAVDGILILSADGKVVAANESFARMHGYTPEEIPSLTMKDLDTPEAYRTLPEKVAQVLAGGSHTFEIEHLHHDGHVIPLEVTTSVVTIGGETLIQAFHRDISERKHVEGALRESQALLKAIIDGTTDAVYVKDLEGRYRLFNAAAARYTGRSAAEVLGKNDSSLFPPDEAKAIEEREHAALQGVAPSSYEETVTFPNAQPMTFWTTVGPILDGEGRAVALFGISRDITSRKAAETRLQELLREKEALLKEVHHRVKNNLQVVSSLLRLEGSRSTLPDTKAAFEEMNSRVRSMAMLHELLYHSGTYASVDLGAYLRRLATDVFRATALSPSSIQLHFDLASVHLGMDQATPCGLLVNELLSNCLEHGFPLGHTGEILVELHRVDGKPSVRLRVSDTGVGLPEDFAARSSGSLGLQLVSDLARQLGGTLEIGPGPAAVFTVIFPVKELKG